MSKYCYNCGAEIKERKSFCGDCGAKIDIKEVQMTETFTEQSGEQVKKKKKNKKLKIIALAAGCVLFIGIITAVILGSMNSSTYETPIKNWVNGVETHNFRIYKSAYLEGTESLEGGFNSFCRDIGVQVGKNYKIEYEINDREELDKESLESIGKKNNLKLSQGYKLKTVLTLDGSDDKKSLNNTFIVVKNNGAWYISSDNQSDLNINWGNPSTATSNPKYAENPDREPIDNLLEGLNNKNFDMFICSFVPSVQSTIKGKMQAENMTAVGYMEALKKGLTDTYGTDITLSCGYDYSNELDSNSIREMMENLKINQMPSAAFSEGIYINFDSSTQNKTSRLIITTAKINGKWYVINTPDFLRYIEVFKNNIDQEKYKDLFNAVINGIINKDFMQFKKAFPADYFENIYGKMSSWEETERLTDYFDRYKYSSNPKLSYRFMEETALSGEELVTLKNRNKLSSVPTEGYKLLIKWTVIDNTSQKSSLSYAQIVKIDNSWYFANLDPFNL